MDGNEQSYEARKSDRTGTTIMVRSERRRRWSGEQKLAIVQETLEPGAITAVVARRHGIGTGQLYTWRKQLLEGAMAGFAPVELTPSSSPATRDTLASGIGTIEIATAGGTRIAVSGQVDRRALKTVLVVLSELGQ